MAFELLPSLIRTRLGSGQPLWVLASPAGTLLCARLEGVGLTVLSWTTREEMERGVERLAARAPSLFASHQPQQRPLADLLKTARDLGAVLRIDDYAVLAVVAAEQ
ncbi:MAG: hypothetical protein HY320_07855 [Armatimonadetes bacterium]|nr:hypothetical protein [Armatimonadota bacterium]